jgi:Family of unknown function (DUF6510)
MEALDGNAIGGLMHEVFGVEMTAVRGTCMHCGAVAQMAELVVYLEAPGTVGRCRTCENVVLVVVDVRGIKCVDLSGLDMLEHA